jgi:FkbM family methyltransferase
MDVILRCKEYSSEVRERFEKNIQSLPVDKTIIETSFPLGLATMRAIQKVETDRFVALDDDVEIPNDWLDQVSKYMASNVAAVDGHLRVKGLDGWDDKLNKVQLSEPKFLKKGERAWTWDVYCRTDIFKDWRPSRPDLTSWEDFEIGNHVLGKNYQWISVPILNGYHNWSWKKIEKNALWSAEGFKQTHSKLDILKEIIKCYRFISKIGKDDPLQEYTIYQTMKFIDGLKSRSRLEKPHEVQGNKMYFGDRFSYVIRGIKASGFYEITRSKLAKYVNKNSVCVDVGANIGYWTLLFSQLGKKVYSFEPDDYNFSMLDLNCRTNNCNNVVLSQVAVGEENSFTNLYHSNQCTGMHRIYKSKWCTDTYKQVPMIKLDGIVREKVDFIKIDVEGSELGVLRGASKILENKPIIYMEYDYDSVLEYGANHADIFELLKDYNITKSINNLLCIPKV